VIWGPIFYRRHWQIFYLLVAGCDLHRPVAPPATTISCGPSPGASDFVASAAHRRRARRRTLCCTCLCLVSIPCCFSSLLRGPPCKIAA
jgi:hypothetical protein